MHDAFFHPDGDGFVATPLTRGPWDDRHQHGGPPSALVTGALARFGDAEGYALARVTVELLRPVPIGALTVEVVPERLGRQVQRLSATLRAEGEAVLRAAALRIQRAPLELPPPAVEAAWPDPEALDPFEFPFFRCDVGYHKAVEVKIAEGAWGTTPVRVWARPKVPLVAGRDTLPVERLLILADAQSGMGPPLDPLRWTYLNPDLTVYLEREPRGRWLGFDIRSVAGPDGAGLSQSAVRDAAGTFARSAQSLVVAPRR